MSQKYGFEGERPYISTVKGNRFYIDAPVFDAEEMAHATSMMCRFGGHVRRFYSVAEHQLLVAMLCEQLQLADPFEGLLHDGHEGYLVDLNKPWKAAITGYVSVEHKLETALRKQYKLPLTITAGCKKADLIALAIEAQQLLPNHGVDIVYPPGIVEQARALRDIHLNGYAPGLAGPEWLAAFHELRPANGA